MRVVRGEARGRDELQAAGALIALGAGAACFVTGESLPVGLLPQLSASLHASLSATGLLVTLYAAVVFIVSAPLTHLTRDLPRRVLLSGVLAIFVIGTLASAGASGYGWLLGARIVTAVAQAVFWSVAPVTAAGLPARRHAGVRSPASSPAAQSASCSAYRPQPGWGSGQAGASRSSCSRASGCWQEQRSPRCSQPAGPPTATRPLALLPTGVATVPSSSQQS